ncbi:uncharacterized protein [Cherax quadricarinatus]|uniref:uncharacterized protein n=1 Tax=Cherax quadricarinatus TaxID=27406 RepID=UPI00387EACE1
MASCSRKLRSCALCLAFFLFWQLQLASKEDGLTDCTTQVLNEGAQEDVSLMDTSNSDSTITDNDGELSLSGTSNSDHLTADTNHVGTLKAISNSGHASASTEHVTKAKAISNSGQAAGNSDNTIKLEFINNRGIITTYTFNQPTPGIYGQNPSIENQLRSLGIIKFLELIYNPHNFMFLCDHPPVKFSSSFLGKYDDKCFGNHHRVQFNSVLSLCLYTYNVIYGSNSLNYAEIKITSSNQIFVVFYGDDFVNICLPMFMRYNYCKDEDLFTLCQENNQSFAFFHSKRCPRSPHLHDDYYSLIISNFLDGNIECIRTICQGSHMFIDGEVAGLRFRVTNFNVLINNTSCYHKVNPIRLFAADEIFYFTMNIHWPCCYPNYFVAWKGCPEERGLIGAWNYLPLSCRISELVLIVIVAVIMVSGVVGNLMVVVVMLMVMVMENGPQEGHESIMLRTSLAFSDLLVSLFVVVPSFYYHLEPFFTLFYRLLIDSPYLIREDDFILFSYIKPFDEGFPLFQAFLFCLYSIVSLLTLFLLSVERLVFFSRPSKYCEYFTVRRVWAAITFTWVLGFLDTLLFMYHRDGYFVTHWSTFNKLPIFFSVFHPDSLFYKTLHNSQLVLLETTSYCTIVVSVLAIWTFQKQQARESREWNKDNMGYSGPRDKENRHILVTQIVMTVCLFVSNVPLHIDISFILTEGLPSIYKYELISYICWWLFLSGTAWNPWIYNAQSRKFRNDATRILRKIIPGMRGKDENTVGRTKMLLALGLEAKQE